MLRGYSVLIYLFLYAPIALIVLFSFNAGTTPATSTASRLQLVRQGRRATRFVIEALENSLIIAATSAALATVIGTMAALALPRRCGGPCASSSMR